MHGIRVALNVHLDWVVLQVDIANAFNIVYYKVIFQELHVASGQLFQFIPFIHSFFAPHLLLFLVTTPFKAICLFFNPSICTCQGDPLGGLFFALTHFRTFHNLATFSHLVCFLPL
jgi:hypothetical protein